MGWGTLWGPVLARGDAKRGTCQQSPGEVWAKSHSKGLDVNSARSSLCRSWEFGAGDMEPVATDGRRLRVGHRESREGAGWASGPRGGRGWLHGSQAAELVGGGPAGTRVSEGGGPSVGCGFE